MVDKTSGRIRKAGGVRFSAQTTDSSDEHEEYPLKTSELQWEECCNNERSFDLYFGILKLSHIYTMNVDVVFHRTLVKLDIVLDQQSDNGLQLLVNELPLSSADSHSRYEAEVIIHPETLPGPFHRTFLFRETSATPQRSVTVNVRGKILREGQGTATLRHGVHMKSIIKQVKEDDE